MKNEKAVYMSNLVVYLMDFLLFNIAILLCWIPEWWPHSAKVDTILANWLIADVAYLIAQKLIPIELHKRTTPPAVVIKNVTMVAILFGLLNDAILGMAHYTTPGFWRTLTISAIVWGTLTPGRFLLRELIKHMRIRGFDPIRSVFVGYGFQASKVASILTERWRGYQLMGVFTDGDENGLMTKEQLEASKAKDIKVLGKLDDALEWMKQHEMDELYVALGNQYDEWLAPLLRLCEQRMVRVFYIPQSHATNKRQTYPMEFGETVVFSQYREPLLSLSNRFYKRTFDFVVSLLFVLLVFWWVYLLVALITKITMPGPIFFRQLRTGYNGRDFYCLKFRSMKVNKDADKLQATRGDDRITRWGHFMRHTSIDELPQFLNVLKGDMSLVGPRPHMLAHTDYYSSEISDYMVRHFVKPGITGWAQTHGSRGETKTVHDMARRVELDIWYIEHWSFWLDLQIMVRTVKNILQGEKEAF